MQQSIEAELQQPFLMLRGMYDGDKLDFDAQGNLIGNASPMPFALSFLMVTSVRVMPDSVAIGASRAGLEITQRGPIGTPDKVKAVPIAGSGRFQVVIAIQRDPQHDELLQAAMNRVFHAGFNDSLIEAAPQYWRPWIGHELHPEKPFAETPVGVATPQSLRAESKPVKMPFLSHTVEPPTTEAARIRRLSGVSVITLVVDSSGIPRDIAIERPLGMGLDEMAVATVAQYRFKPATNRGHPVPVEVNIEVNFRN